MNKWLIVPVSLLLVGACGAGEVTGEKDVAFQVNIHPHERNVEFELSVRNKTTEPISLLFMSGQQYDIFVTDKDGNTVYRASEGKMFLQVLMEETMEGGEEKKWTDTWEAVSPGTYKVTCQLLVSEINGEPTSEDTWTVHETFTVE